jgi:hypothetical protein
MLFFIVCIEPKNTEHFPPAPLCNLKPVSAASKPLGSLSPLSRRVFLAQDGARQELKIREEPSRNKLSEYVFFNSVRFL